MDKVKELKDLAHSAETCALKISEIKQEMNELDREIEKLKHPIDYSIVFNKDLKNAEQRDVQRKEDYEQNIDLQDKIVKRDNMSKSLKDNEANLEYIKNLLKIDLAFVRADSYSEKNLRG